MLPETQQDPARSKVPGIVESLHQTREEGHRGDLLTPHGKTPCVLRAFTLHLHGGLWRGGLSSPRLCRRRDRGSGRCRPSPGHVTGSGDPRARFGIADAPHKGTRPLRTQSRRGHHRRVLALPQPRPAPGPPRRLAFLRWQPVPRGHGQLSWQVYEVPSPERLAPPPPQTSLFSRKPDDSHTEQTAL